MYPDTSSLLMTFVENSVFASSLRAFHSSTDLAADIFTFSDVRL